MKKSSNCSPIKKKEFLSRGHKKIEYDHNKTCPIDQGQCIENLCFCSPGFTTFYPKNEIIKEELCNYSYKYKYNAIWFEMILPFGLGHFYACRYFHGVIKFLYKYYKYFII